jgi:hypothetical protein
MYLSKFKKYLFGLITFLVACFVIEIVSFVTLLAYDSIKYGVNKAYKWRIVDFPIWYEDQDANEPPLVIEKLRGHLVGHDNALIYDPWLGIRMAPLHTSGYSKTGSLKTDQYGFIFNTESGTFVPDKSPSVYRIFLIGGSTATGIGASSNNTALAASIEKILNGNIQKLNKRRLEGEQISNIEVINAASYSYYSPQTLVSIALELINYDPNLIIVLNGRNDARIALRYDYERNQALANLEKSKLTPYHELKFHNTIRQKSSLLNFESEVGLLRVALLYTLESFANRSYTSVILLKFSNLWMKLTHPHEQLTYVGRINLPSTTSPYSPDLTMEGVDYYVSFMTNIAGIGLAQNIKIMTLLQPTLGVGEKVLTSDEMSLKQIYPDSRYEQFQVFFQESEKRLKGSALPRKYPRQLMFASLTDIFDEVRETVYVDTAHYNQKGNDLIAENIARLTQVFIEK